MLASNDHCFYDIAEHEYREQHSIENLYEARCLAMELAKRGVRKKVIPHLLPAACPCDTELNRLYEELRTRGIRPNAGRLPKSCVSIFMTPEECIAASQLLLSYNVWRKPEWQIDPWAICHVWDERPCKLHFAIDATVLWFLARDQRTKEVYLEKCPNCHAQHIYFTELAPGAKRNRCPYCMLAGGAKPRKKRK